MKKMYFIFLFYKIYLNSNTRSGFIFLSNLLNFLPILKVWNLFEIDSKKSNWKLTMATVHLGHQHRWHRHGPTEVGQPNLGWQPIAENRGALMAC
jgi:hypothetical protein